MVPPNLKQLNHLDVFLRILIAIIMVDELELVTIPSLIVYFNYYYYYYFDNPRCSGQFTCTTTNFQTTKYPINLTTR
jgi:hypothetical protein